MTRTILIRLLMALAFLIPQGCGTHTPGGPILSRSIQKDINRIGILIRESEEESLEESRHGWSNSIGHSMGSGAAGGSALGMAGQLCLYLAPVCMVGLAVGGATIGALGGAVHGVYQASTETLPSDVEATLGQAIKDAGLRDLLRKHLVADGQAYGYPMTVAKPASIITEQNQGALYPTLHDSFDTLLEIEGPVVNLLPTSWGRFPPRRVGLSAHVRIIRVADQEVLEEEFILEEFGDSHSLEEWTANQAQHFREELPRATRRLSEKFLIDLFMRYTFTERTYSLSGWGWLGPSYVLRGLDSPNTRKHIHKQVQNKEAQKHRGFEPIRVESLRPTGRWEPFPGDGVTYDLIIWESKESREVVGEVVYERRGLTNTVHTLEQDLKPATLYTWSVRARFVEEGKIRLTEWSKYKIGGYDEWGFYQFQTPQWGELSH